MNSQNVDSIIGDEQIKPLMMPAQGANVGPADIITEEWDLNELIDYMPVPPRRVLTTSVRYRHLGRGRPLPYPLPEDCEE